MQGGLPPSIPEPLFCEFLGSAAWHWQIELDQMPVQDLQYWQYNSFERRLNAFEHVFMCLQAFNQFLNKKV